MDDNPSSQGQQAIAIGFLGFTVVMVRFSKPGDGSPGGYVWGRWRSPKAIERITLNELLKQTWKR